MTKLAGQQQELKKKTFSKKQNKLNSFKLGLGGEKIATNFLKKKHFCIVAQNCSWDNFEVDIIAFDLTKKELVFVEVKTRSSNFFRSAIKSVNYKKRSNMMKLAQKFIKKYNFKGHYRFDMILVLSNLCESHDSGYYQIRHFKNITV